MTIFKTASLKWWQVSIFKISLLALGIAIGSYFADVFVPYQVHLLVLAIVTGIYISYVWLKQ